MVLTGAISGAVAGVSLGFLGDLAGFSNWLPAQYASLTLLGLAVLDLSPMTPPVALRRWQVPVTWVQRGDLTDFATWGLSLGSGLLTHPGSNIVLGLWIAVLLTQDLAAATWIGLVYGAMRMLTVAVYSLVLTGRSSDGSVDFASCPIFRLGHRARIFSALANASLAALLIAIPE